MKGIHCKVWIVLGLLQLATPLYAYWSETHQKFADAAIKGNAGLSSVEKNESMADYYTNRLGFPLDRKYLFDNVEALSIVPDELMSKDNGIYIIPENDKLMRGSEIFKSFLIQPRSDYAAL